MLGADSYRNATKETWRGWVWNRIVERLPGFNPKMGPAALRRLCEDKTVLYLPGPDDLDRRCAMKRGFRNENLIAVDISKERAENVRAAGGLAIRGTIQEVVASWPLDWPVNIVMADYCGGLTWGNAGIVLGLARGGIVKGGIVAINMMRGRESFSSEDKRNLIEYRDTIKRFPGGLPSNADKNRAVMFMYNLYHFFIHSLQNREGGLQVLLNWFCKMRPTYMTYRSHAGAVYFDSVVFVWPAAPATCVCDDIGHITHLDKQFYKDVLGKKIIRDDGIERRIAALRAVRTMKLKALAG